MKNAKVTGYKILHRDGRSLIRNFRYPLPAGADPGPWTTVPANGAYVALPGQNLFAADVKLHADAHILVEVEGDEPLSVPNSIVANFRRVRVLHVLKWTEIPADQGHWRWLAARDIKGLNDDERRTLILQIPATQGEWRYWAARDVKCLSDDERRQLVFQIPADQGKWRYLAAYNIKGLSDDERRTLILQIPVTQGEWRYYAAYNIKCLSDDERCQLVLEIPPDQGHWRYWAGRFIPGLSDDERRALEEKTVG